MGLKKCQGSVQPVWPRKAEISFAILEGACDFGFERSRFGFNTQFRSPPKIK